MPATGVRSARLGVESRTLAMTFGVKKAGRRQRDRDMRVSPVLTF
jgi:hypothetical protein